MEYWLKRLLFVVALIVLWRFVRRPLYEAVRRRFSDMTHHHSAAGDETGVMRNVANIAWIGGIASTAFLATGLALLTIWSDRYSHAAVPIVFLVLSGGAFCMFVDGIGTRHMISDDGLEHHFPFRGTVFLAWEEVVRVDYSETMRWWILETENFPRRVSAAMSNQPLFEQVILDRVSPYAIAPEIRELLNQTAAGDPPSAY